MALYRRIAQAIDDMKKLEFFWCFDDDDWLFTVSIGNQSALSSSKNVFLCFNLQGEEDYLNEAYKDVEGYITLEFSDIPHEIIYFYAGENEKHLKSVPNPKKYERVVYDDSDLEELFGDSFDEKMCHSIIRITFQNVM